MRQSAPDLEAKHSQIDRALQENHSSISRELQKVQKASSVFQRAMGTGRTHHWMQQQRSSRISQRYREMMTQGGASSSKTLTTSWDHSSKPCRGMPRTRSYTVLYQQPYTLQDRQALRQSRSIYCNNDGLPASRGGQRRPVSARWSRTELKTILLDVLAAACIPDIISAATPTSWTCTMTSIHDLVKYESDEHG